LGRMDKPTEHKLVEIIAGLLPKKKPGIRWKEVMRLASEKGIGSTATVSKYLKIGIYRGYIIQEGKTYRQREMSAYWGRDKHPIVIPREEIVGSKPYEILPVFDTGSDHKPLVESESGLSLLVKHSLYIILTNYVWMLESLVKIDKKRDAWLLVQQFSNTLFESFLENLTEQVWRARNKAPIESLERTVVELRKIDRAKSLS
jgi:hypothetical protein